MPTEEIIVIAIFKARNGKETELIERLKSNQVVTLTEKGCIEYRINQDTKDPLSIVMYERWTNQTALDLHFTMPYMIEWVNMREIYVESRELKILKEVL